MKKNNRFVKALSIFVILSLFILLIASCKPMFKPARNNGNCSYELAADYHTAYDFGSQDSKYVYVLIDQAYDYKHTPEDLKLLSKTITANMFPEDRLVVAWINLDDSTKTIIFDERVERTRLPEFPPTFIAPPVTPTLTPSNITTIQGQQIQTNEAIDKDNQVINEKYFCKIGEWNAISDNIYQEWQHEQKEEVDSFNNEANSVLAPSIAKNSSSGKLIYESLSTASQMLQTAIAKRQHDKYILIVFSDMNDWRPSKPENIKINLKGIDALIVSQQCKYEIDCTVKATWETQLTDFRAVNPLFLVQEDNISNSIFDYLVNIP